MKKLPALFIFLLLSLLPQLASAGEGKEGFVLMFLLGGGGALFLLAAFSISLLLTANTTRSGTTMTVLSIAGGLAWGLGTLWCFGELLNPVFWFADGGMWSANHRTDWQSYLSPWFLADVGCAALVTALAWRQWFKRRQRYLRDEQLDLSLQ